MPGRRCRRHMHRLPLAACCLLAADPLSLPATPQEAELEAKLFGRDEEALQQLGREVGGGAALDDFLRSYAAGAAAAAAAGSDDEGSEEGGDQRPRDGGPLMYEDRRGAGDSDASDDEQQAAAAAASARRRAPVWEDPQDARLRVNVAASARLRKLRQTEEEAEISGACWLGAGWLGAGSGPAMRSAAVCGCRLPCSLMPLACKLGGIACRRLVPLPRPPSSAACRPAIREAAAPAAQQAAPAHRLGQPEGAAPRRRQRRRRGGRRRGAAPAAARGRAAGKGRRAAACHAGNH